MIVRLSGPNTSLWNRRADEAEARDSSDAVPGSYFLIDRYGDRRRASLQQRQGMRAFMHRLG